MSYRKHFFVSSTLCCLFIHSFSACFSMDSVFDLSSEAETKKTRRSSVPLCDISEESTVPIELDEDQIKKNINDAIFDAAQAHRDEHPLGLRFRSQWVQEENDQKDFSTNIQHLSEFSYELDKAIYFPNSRPCTSKQRWLDRFSKVWGGGFFGMYAGAAVPIIFTVGDAYFDWLPRGYSLEYIPFALMVGAGLSQGGNFVDSFKIFHTDELIPAKLGQTDNKPHIILDEDSKASKFISGFGAIWTKWPILFFFWIIEEATLETRYWRSIFILSYIAHELYKSFSYSMDYFEKENIKNKNNQFNIANKVHKEHNLNSLRQMDMLRNGQESHSLVMALKGPVEERRKTIELFLKIEHAMNRDYSDWCFSSWLKNKPDKMRNEALRDIIFKYITDETPPLLPALKQHLESKIFPFVEKVFSINDTEKVSFIYNAHKIHNFAKRNIIYYKNYEIIIEFYNKMQLSMVSLINSLGTKEKNRIIDDSTIQAAEKTLKNDVSAYISFILNNKQLDHAEEEWISTEIKRILIESAATNKISSFNSTIENKIVQEETRLLEPTHCLESGLSLLLAESYNLLDRPASLLRKSRRQKEEPKESTALNLDIQEDVDFMEEQQSILPKSRTEKFFKIFSTSSLYFSLPVYFIGHLWAYETMLGLMGAEPNFSFWPGVTFSALSSCAELVRGRYTHKMTFEHFESFCEYFYDIYNEMNFIYKDFKNMGVSAIDRRVLKLPIKIIIEPIPTILFSVAPGGFSSMAAAGMALRKLETADAWLKGFLLTIGMPKELWANYSFFKEHQDKIKDWIVINMIPECAPEFLKVIQERAKQNALSRNAKSVIERLNERSIKKYHEILHFRKRN